MFSKRLLLLFLCISLKISAQEKIKGKIINVVTKEPIAFASIATDSTLVGSVSNVNGEFEINYKKLPVKFSVNNYGYQFLDTIYNAKKDSFIIQLKPCKIILQKPVEGIPALNLVRNAVYRAQELTALDYTGLAYTRQIALEAGRPKYLMEALFDANWKNYGILKWKINSGRLVERNPSFSYRNINFYQMIFAGYVQTNLYYTPICARPDSLYNYALTNIYRDKNQEIGVINCRIKDNLSPDKAFFDGNIYIDLQSYDLLKVDGFINNLDISASDNTGLIRSNSMHIMSQYRLDADGYYTLDFANLNMRNMLTYNGAGIKNNEFNSIIYILNTKKIDRQNLVETQLNANSTVFSTSTQKNDFWKKNAIVRRTEREDAAIKILEARDKNK